MTHGNKIWVQMKHKYHSNHIKQNKCKRQNIFKPHNEKYDKVLNLGGFWPPNLGNDPTRTIFIEIVIFHTFILLVAKSEKYRSQEVASNKLEKGPLRDYETAFCLLLALMVLEKKIF
jgi:hypothetical protein